MPNLIRLKQLDQTELSGYIGEISISQNFNYVSSNFNYYSGNFNISERYLNLVNYASGITGTLPAINNGLRYNIKNIGDGILTITGANNIDGLDSAALQKNESVELLGVSNLYYTGWVTILSNPGI
jgi:hypothetical protein